MLFLPNIDALNKSKSQHKLFLNQSKAQSLKIKTNINTHYEPTPT